MRNKLHPKGLRLVCLDADLDGNIVKEFHVVRLNLASGAVSQTACGIGGVNGFQFPFHGWIWKSTSAPICEKCYHVVQPELRQDVGF